ncbi:MAG TPA: V4R domain-containing protein [Gemmatimonadales bacterium]|jgi:predicted hydrocarbon binding protein|nr:V4R domain-containing protein [Gemmatimonadales bacterium]
MPVTTAAAPQHTFLISHRSLQHLRLALERDAGAQAAAWLQEAGFAGGEAMYQVYADWLAGRFSVDRPAALDVRHLGETMSAFFQEFGWGSVEVSPITPAVIAIDSSDWWEADASSGAQYPSCHLSSGLLAEFLSRVSETTLAVMEVECRSRGDARCRFLAGAPETLQILYGRMAEGSDYMGALGTGR